MKRLLPVLFFAALYFTAAGVRICWLTRKNGFMVDETASVVLAYYNEYMLTADYDFNKTYTGKEVKETGLCDSGGIKSAAADVFRLWRDNRDTPHTNFYYSLLRLFLTGLKTGEIRAVVFRGGALNMLLFTVSFLFFWLLLKLLFSGSALIPVLGTFFAYMSTAAISNTLLLRPYQLQETMFVIFAYFFVRFFGVKKYAVSDGILYVNPRIVFAMSCIAALTLLTGYYSVIFIGLFGVYAVYVNKAQKNSQEIMVYVIVFFTAILFAQLFYSRYIAGFVSGRARETAETVAGHGAIKNAVSSLICGIGLLAKHFFTVPLIAVSAGILLFLLFGKNRLECGKYVPCIFVVSLLYLFAVTFMAPYKILRYSMPVFPFFALLPVSLLSSIKSRKASCAARVLLCAVFILNLFSNDDTIENVYRNKPQMYLFARDKTVPVMVVNGSIWKYMDLVPYFDDEQSYIFSDSLPAFSAVDEYDSFYLLVEKKPDSDNISFDHYRMGPDFDIGYFTGRKYTRQED